MLPKNPTGFFVLFLFFCQANRSDTKLWISLQKYIFTAPLYLITMNYY